MFVKQLYKIKEILRKSKFFDDLTEMFKKI